MNIISPSRKKLIQQSTVLGNGASIWQLRDSDGKIALVGDKFTYQPKTRWVKRLEKWVTPEKTQVILQYPLGRPPATIEVRIVNAPTCFTIRAEALSLKWRNVTRAARTAAHRKQY